MPYEKIPKDKLSRVSLDLAVNSKSSPMYIWHTREDEAVPIDGSLKLAAAAYECGINFMCSIFPYGPHAIGLGREAYEKYPQKIQPIAATWFDSASAGLETLPDDTL